MKKVLNFFKTNKKVWIFLTSCLVFTFVCMLFANLLQTNFGSVDVTEGYFDIHQDVATAQVENNVPNYEIVDTQIYYKQYTPKTATKDNKAPGVLLLHGYQNDHETSAAFAIELAKRGAVVVAIDEYGHGKTTTSMLQRGILTHAIKTTFGYDSVSPQNGAKKATYVEIGGQTRYKLLLNFSNLSFFSEHYSTDSDGNKLNDSSMGGIAAYAYLAGLENVDPSKMMVSGHSMGTWSSWTVAAAYSGALYKGQLIEPKAIVLQCGEYFRAYNTIDNVPVYDPLKIHFNNILMLQAKWDEFNYFRDYNNVVDESLIKKGAQRWDFLAESLDPTLGEQGEFDKTYGSFALGRARRVELLYTNHRLVTHNRRAIRTTIEWAHDTIGLDLSTYSAKQETFKLKEYLVLFAMFSAIASMFGLLNLLLRVPLFAKVITPLAEERKEQEKPTKKWIKGAIITMAISALTYPFLCQLGQGLFPLPDTSVFRMTIGNGFLIWYLFLIVVMLCFTIFGRLSAKKKGKHVADFVDMGLSREEKKDKFDWKLLGISALLVCCLVGFYYLQLLIYELAFGLDFRFIWPFFKTFTWTRLLQFFIYVPMFLVFFILNNSRIFAMGRVQGTTEPGFKNFMKVWWKYALCMAGGIIFIILLEYIPFFANIGPGVDLLFSSTFGGPFMSLMIVFVPQILVFSVICTYCYRKTNNVFLGAILVAVLACWVVCGGSAML